MRADSGGAALEAIKDQNRATPVALLLADHRMPQMDGAGFLTEAKTVFPDSKRALLTAYADTDAAIPLINYYLLKRGETLPGVGRPAERLASVLPPFTGIKIVGGRWSTLGHTLRDFLARSQVPYRWLDVEREDEAKALMAGAGLTKDDLPAVIFEDGGPCEMSKCACLPKS